MEGLPEDIRPGKPAQQAYDNDFREILPYFANISDENQEEYALFVRFFAELDAAIAMRH